MKTVSGEVVSTKPVSLSKAARILSKFASSDNGASPAFAAYLKRASASFDELAQLHKKCKTSGGKRTFENSIESRILQEVNTKVKSNSSVINRDEIREHRGLNKVEKEAETKGVNLNVDEERHQSKKKIKEAEEKSDSLNADEERNKSKKKIREEAERKVVSLNVDEERHKSKKRIKDEENMHKSKKGKHDDDNRNKKRKRDDRHDLD